MSSGWTLDVWDLNTAQQLHTLLPPGPGGGGGASASGGGDDDEGLQFDDPSDHDDAGGSPFTCVSYCGDLLAAGGWAGRGVGALRFAAADTPAGSPAQEGGLTRRACPDSAPPLSHPAGRHGSVVLFDLRCRDAVGCLAVEGASAGPCVGVQLDDWKLVTGRWQGGPRDPAPCLTPVQAAHVHATPLDPPSLLERASTPAAGVPCRRLCLGQRRPLAGRVRHARRVARPP